MSDCLENKIGGKKPLMQEKSLLLLVSIFIHSYTSGRTFYQLSW